MSFQQVDAYKLTGVKGQFSAAMAVDWLAHVPKSRMDNFLQGLHNLLKPGSKVIFCDELQGESPLTKGIFDSDGNHIQKRTLPNGTSYKVIKNYMLRKKLKQYYVRILMRLKLLNLQWKMPINGLMVG